MGFMQKFGQAFLVQAIVAALLTGCAFSTAWAQQTSRPLLDPLRNVGNSLRNIGGGKTVEADPNKEYRLTETDGPYLILAVTLVGPTAQKDARELVLELRSKHRWNAYMFEKNFTRDANRDFGQTKGAIRYRIQGETQFVVLVGNFPSLEDNQFKRTLDEIRKTQPESLKGKTSVAAFSFPNAYGVANPMVPPVHQHGTIDPFIEAINKNRPFSLLKNPRRYTVNIATFTGRAIMEPEAIRAIESGKNSQFDRQVSALEMGEQAAIELCRILRAQGVEAYEFHDKHASIVTIGSFDQPGKMMPDGTMVQDPHIQQIIQHYQGKVINGMRCVPQPRLIEVPRVAHR